MVTSVRGFSDADYQALADWIERRGRGIVDIVELEGFLTAVVIGPHTLQPMQWLPKVWGARPQSFATSRNSTGSLRW
jgi:uncharacterized protein